MNPMRGVVFDPGTLIALGMNAATAGTVGTIATIAGPVLGVMGAIQGQKEGWQQVAEHERAATETRVSAGVEAEKARRSFRQSQSRDMVAMAEGGVLSGTSFGVLEQNAVSQELDALMIEYRGEQAGKAEDFRAKQAKPNPLDVFSAAVSGASSFDPLNLAPGGGA